MTCFFLPPGCWLTCCDLGSPATQHQDGGNILGIGNPKPQPTHLPLLLCWGVDPSFNLQVQVQPRKIPEQNAFGSNKQLIFIFENCHPHWISQFEKMMTMVLVKLQYFVGSWVKVRISSISIRLTDRRDFLLPCTYQHGSSDPELRILKGFIPLAPYSCLPTTS